ncbi:MAG TPA: flagellar biosynthesis protein FlhF [Chloroflexota bacterium]|nr:flagellar biosynthesis protein FlhF [Chloroflexota bacterium]
MRTKPFRAADKATALRMIRDELGPDALILQERRVKPGLFGLLGPEQVEIIAGIDDLTESAPVAPSAPAAHVTAPSNGVHADFSAAARRLARDVQDADPRDLLPPTPAAGGLSDEGASKLAAILESFSKSGQPVPPAMAASLADLIGRSAAGEEVTLPAPAPPPAPKPASEARNGSLQDTLPQLQGAIQRLTQQQQDAQFPRESPAVRLVYQQLIAAEVDPGLALDLAGQLSDEIGADVYADPERVGRRLTELFEERLQVAKLRLPPHFQFIERTAPPCVVVLVGPTGVGKTTTLAKLASHFAFTEGKKVALVTTDTFRIAAAQQLGTYAEILELPLEIVYRAEEVPAAIRRHMDADIVLVDTPGCGQQDDVKIGELSAFVDATVDTVPDAVVLLTLAAPTKLRDLLSVQRGFAPVHSHGLIFTKLDETNAYGPVVSLAARVRKPVYFLATGQMVPNDIEVATRRRLARLVQHGLAPVPAGEEVA